MQGVIQHSTINNLAFGRNIEETLRVLQALQYVQVRQPLPPSSHMVHTLPCCTLAQINVPQPSTENGLLNPVAFIANRYSGN